MLCIVSLRPVEETMLDIVIVILVVATAAWIALRLVRNQQHAAKIARMAARQAEVDAMVASAAMTQRAKIEEKFARMTSGQAWAVFTLLKGKK